MLASEEDATPPPSSSRSRIPPLALVESERLFLGAADLELKPDLSGTELEPDLSVAEDGSSDATPAESSEANSIG